jgi:MYXO-CTERM domain-containing protein
MIFSFHLHRSLLGPALALFALPAHGAISVFNQNNPMDTTDLPSGGWGSYRGFSVAFNTTALTTTYSAPDTAPLPATIYLTDLTIRRAGTSGTATVGDPANALLKVYTSQTPSPATWVADSTNTGDMRQGVSETNISFGFDTVPLSSSTTYYFYFGNTLGDGSVTPIAWTDGRLRVSNNSNITYAGGNLINGSFGNQDTAYDAVFVGTFSSVPEPSIALLGGLGLLAMRRRRR